MLLHLDIDEATHLLDGVHHFGPPQQPLPGLFVRLQHAALDLRGPAKPRDGLLVGPQNQHPLPGVIFIKDENADVELALQRPDVAATFANKSPNVGHVQEKLIFHHALRHVGFGAVPSFPNLLHAPLGQGIFPLLAGVLQNLAFSMMVQHRWNQQLGALNSLESAHCQNLGLQPNLSDSKEIRALSAVLQAHSQTFNPSKTGGGIF
mmetsp:Transcript_27253/g.56308  ORF Transcript_27253/g.56308 Transcript_27253/m.56308 type:complete len:206 (-) Transcript_27253:26-643(-)